MWHAGSLLRDVGSLVAACGLLVAACMQDPVPGPGIEPGSLALGEQSLTHWTTRAVPQLDISMSDHKTIMSDSLKHLELLKM